MLRGAAPPVLAVPERMDVERPMTMGWEVGGHCSVAWANDDVLVSDFGPSAERLGSNVASDGIPRSSSRLGAAAVGGGAAMVA